MKNLGFRSLARGEAVEYMVEHDNGVTGERSKMVRSYNVEFRVYAKDGMHRDRLNTME